MTAPRQLVAEAFLTPQGIAPDGTTGEPVKVPRVSGFVESAFNPMVRAVVDRCLDGTPLGDEGARTALVLATTFGDAVTADLGSRLLASGQVANPLLFYQTVPTTILGVVARDFGITGPTMCVSTQDDLCAETLDLVDVLLDDDEIDQVVVLAVDLAAGERARQVAEELAVPLAHTETAVSFLVRRGSPDEQAAAALTVAGDRRPEFGALAGLVDLYVAARTSRKSGQVTLTVPLDTALGRRELGLRVSTRNGAAA